jgi:hypothetical protein
MTEDDDGSTDVLDLHLSQPGEAPRRRLATGWVLGGAVALVAVVVGVGIPAVVPHRPPAAAHASPSAAPSTPAGAASASIAGTVGPVPLAEPVVARAALERAGHSAGLLTVGTGELVTGLAPAVVNFHECGGDGKQMEYLPVEFRNPPGGIAGAVTVQPGPATPPGIGRLGFFFESNNGDALPCRPAAAWPTSDTFEAVNGDQLVTGYVVLDEAVTPSAPQGRPDVFRSLQLKISDLRQLDNDNVLRPLSVGTPTVGQLCPGDQVAVCAPLG